MVYKSYPNLDKNENLDITRVLKATISGKFTNTKF